MRVHRLATALAVALLALVLLPAPAARAQQAPRLEVDELEATLRPGGGLVVRGGVVNPGTAVLADVRVVATLQRRTTSRVDFQRAVDGTPARRRTVGSAEVELGAVAPGQRIPVELIADAADLGLGGVDDDVAGVYPLRLQLVSADGVLDELRTGAVALPEQVGEPVRVAVLVPIDSPLGLLGRGPVEGDPLAGGLGEDPRLPGLAAALAAAPEMPLTVATSGAVLRAAADAATDGFRVRDAAGEVVVPADAPEARRAQALVTDLQNVLARDQTAHVALPYASADLVALVRAGQADAAREAVSDGALSAGEATGVRPVPGVLWPPDGLDEPTLDALAAGLDLVVLDAADLATVAAAAVSPLPAQRLRTPTGAGVTALVADPWLSPLIGGRLPGADGQPVPWPGAGGAALAAQRVVAETAALYFEAPFSGEPRGLLLAPPQLWDAPPDAVTRLLEGIAGAPWLRPVTVPDLAAQVASASDPVGLRYPAEARDRELPVDYLGEVADARDEVASLASVLAEGADPDEPARLVQVAASVHERDRLEHGRALLDAVNDTAQRVFDGISVVDGPPFTLTGAGGSRIPVELRNDGTAPVEVLVGLAAAQQFAVEPLRQQVVLPPGEVARVAFDVRALTPGVTRPIAVVVSDLEGERVLARDDMVVRARTSSVTALALMVGAGAVLGAWWFRDARRRRRERPESSHLSLRTLSGNP